MLLYGQLCHFSRTDSFLLHSEQKKANLARFLQELDSKNAFSYKILQEFS